MHHHLYENRSSILCDIDLDVGNNFFPDENFLSDETSLILFHVEKFLHWNSFLSYNWHYAYEKLLFFSNLMNKCNYIYLLFDL
jgi:hypothetical protein